MLARVHSRRYGGHNNAPPKVRLGNAMPPLGLAMVQIDLPGHGYSEGERAYIEQYSHWVDDIFQVLYQRLCSWCRSGRLAPLHTI